MLRVLIGVWLALAVTLADKNMVLHELAILEKAPPLSEIDAIIKGSASLIEARNADGQTPLIVASAVGTDEVMTQLIKAGANVEATDNQGRTPMHWTTHKFMSKSNLFRKIRALRKGGANINARDKDGLTTLHQAVRNNAPDAVRVLIDSGASLTEMAENGTPLHYAALVGSHAAITALAKGKANLEVKEQHGYTPLHCAVMTDSVESIKVLVAEGAAMDSQNGMGLTPLQFAVTLGKVNSIKALVALGSDPEAAYAGITPFELAATNKTLLKALHKDEL